MSYPLNFSGSIWFHSEPSEVPYSLYQYLSCDFFTASYRKTALLCLLRNLMDQTYKLHISICKLSFNKNDFIRSRYILIGYLGKYHMICLSTFLSVYQIFSRSKKKGSSSQIQHLYYIFFLNSYRDVKQDTVGEVYIAASIYVSSITSITFSWDMEFLTCRYKTSLILSKKPNRL